MASDRTDSSSPTRLPDVSTGPTPGDPDWTDQVTDMVVNLVSDVKEKTTGPVLKGGRIAVYGVIIALVAITAFILVIIGVGRAAALLPGPNWIGFTIAGLLFCLAGSLLWTRRAPS